MGLVGVASAPPWCQRLSGTALELLELSKTVGSGWWRGGISEGGEGGVPLPVPVPIPIVANSRVCLCAGHVALTLRFDQIGGCNEDGEGGEASGDGSGVESTILASMDSPQLHKPSIAASAQDVTEALEYLLEPVLDDSATALGGGKSICSDRHVKRGSLPPCVVIRHSAPTVYTGFLPFRSDLLIFASIDSKGFARFWQWQPDQKTWKFLNYLTLSPSNRGVDSVPYATICVEPEKELSSCCKIFWVEDSVEERKGAWTRRLDFSALSRRVNDTASVKNRNISPADVGSVGDASANANAHSLVVGLAVQLITQKLDAILSGNALGTWLITANGGILLLARQSGRLLRAAEALPLSCLYATDCGPSGTGVLYIITGVAVSAIGPTPDCCSLSWTKVCELQFSHLVQPPSSWPLTSILVLGKLLVSISSPLGRCYLHEIASGRLLDEFEDSRLLLRRERGEEKDGCSGMEKRRAKGDCVGRDTFVSLWKSDCSASNAPMLGVLTPNDFCFLSIGDPSSKETQQVMEADFPFRQEPSASGQLISGSHQGFFTKWPSVHHPTAAGSGSGSAGAILQRKVENFLWLVDVIRKRMGEISHKSREGKEGGLDDVASKLAPLPALDLAFGGTLKAWLEGGEKLCDVENVAGEEQLRQPGVGGMGLLGLAASGLTASSVENLPPPLASLLLGKFLSSREKSLGSKNTQVVELLVGASERTRWRKTYSKSDFFDIACRAFYVHEPELFYSFVSLVANNIWEVEPGEDDCDAAAAAAAAAAADGNGDDANISRKSPPSSSASLVFQEALDLGLAIQSPHSPPLNAERLRSLVALHISAGSFSEGCRFIWMNHRAVLTDEEVYCWTIPCLLLEYLSSRVAAARQREGGRHGNRSRCHGQEAAASSTPVSVVPGNAACPFRSRLAMEWETLYCDLFLRCVILDEMEHMRVLLRPHVRPPNFGLRRCMLLVEEGLADSGRLEVIGCSSVDLDSGGRSSATMREAMQALLCPAASSSFHISQ